MHALSAYLCVPPCRCTPCMRVRHMGAGCILRGGSVGACWGAQVSVSLAAALQGYTVRRALVIMRRRVLV